MEDVFALSLRCLLIQLVLGIYLGLHMFQFSSMSMFESGPRLGFAMVSLTLGGFSGSLIFGGATTGGNIVSWGSAMP